MPDLTEAESKKLFEETAKALKEGDNIKLSELMEEPEEKEKKEEKSEEDKSVDDGSDKSSQEEEDVSQKLDDKEKKDEEDADKASDKKPEDKKSPPEEADKATEKKEALKGQDDPKLKEAPKEPTEAEKLKEQIEKLSKENHDLRSQAGRVPSIQRKVREIDKKLEELAKRDTSPSSQPSAKIKPKILDLLKGVSEDDPELAKAIANAIGEAMDGVASEQTAKEKETLTFLRDQEAKTYQDAEAQRLIQMYPNAPEVFKSKSWAEWKAEQTAGIRNLAESDTADEVAFAFDKYAKDMIAKHPELAPKEEAKEKVEAKASPTDAEKEAAEKARRIEEERRRKKESAANVGSPNLSGKINLPDDPVALFEKFSEQIRKERTG
jgi:hypothetical protein